MDKNLKKLLIGRLMSSVADGFFLIALPLFLFESTGSLLDLGLFFMLIKIPSMVLTPKTGVLVEKMNKKSAIVISDYLSALVFGLMAGIQFANYENYLIFGVLSSIYLILGSLFSISSSVLFTQLTDEDNRLKANSVKGILDNGAALATPAIGTMLFTLIGFKGILALNVAIFFLSATYELFIEVPEDSMRDKIEGPMTLRDYKDIFQWLGTNRLILALLIMVMVLNFFVAPNEEVIFVGILIDKYQIPTLFYGLSSTIFVLGSLLASFLIMRDYRLKNLKLSHLFALNSGLLASIGLLSILLSPMDTWKLYYILFLLLMFVVGLITTYINVPLISIFQSDIPLEIQGRFFATLSLGSSLLVPLGIFMAGVFSDLIGPDYTLVFYNILVIGLVLIIKPDDNRNNLQS